MIADQRPGVCICSEPGGVADSGYSTGGKLGVNPEAGGDIPVGDVAQIFVKKTSEQ
jgi:hypothetical protein